MSFSCNEVERKTKIKEELELGNYQHSKPWAVLDDKSRGCSYKPQRNTKSNYLILTLCKSVKNNTKREKKKLLKT